MRALVPCPGRGHSGTRNVPEFRYSALFTKPCWKSIKIGEEWAISCWNLWILTAQRAPSAHFGALLIVTTVTPSAHRIRGAHRQSPSSALAFSIPIWHGRVWVNFAVARSLEWVGPPLLPSFKIGWAWTVIRLIGFDTDGLSSSHQWYWSF